MVTKVRGRFTDVTGTVIIAPNLDDSQVEVTINMRIETDVDATPITAFQCQESAAAEIGDTPSQVRGESCGAA